VGGMAWFAGFASVGTAAMTAEAAAGVAVVMTAGGTVGCPGVRLAAGGAGVTVGAGRASTDVCRVAVAAGSADVATAVRLICGAGAVGSGVGLLAGVAAAATRTTQSPNATSIASPSRVANCALTISTALPWPAAFPLR